ncbi:hypothetical protein DVT68_15080 [Dyella solisilvae]|uniref:Uncharacterized protein n=2 Tax=Dyella solisilvae TaxID=1920168 RepID=A0A370K4P1_9GAMM|nr:hypothetical protein DVT68_15080 [Dyella solisilvae]
MHQMRWRQAPPNRVRRSVALGVVLLLHVLFALLVLHELRLPPWGEPRHAHRDALQVRLIRAAPPAVPSAPPEAVPPPPPPPPKPLVREPPAKQAMTVTLPEPAPAPPATVAPPPQLYDTTGQLRLPTSASTAPAAPEAGYVQRKPQGDSQVMKHDSPVTYQATRFENDWAPDRGNSSIDDALKRAVDKTTVTHTFHVAPGVRVTCAVTLAALAGGCGVGDPPRQPSGRSGDMRLNMAPASSLAPGAPPPPAPSIDDCIAIYRANKPLPQGCPVDTPTRSVDAEMRQHSPQPAPPSGP